jgi:hypothetical protein
VKSCTRVVLMPSLASATTACHLVASQACQIDIRHPQKRFGSCNVAVCRLPSSRCRNRHIFACLILTSTLTQFYFGAWIFLAADFRISGRELRNVPKP